MLPAHRQQDHRQQQLQLQHQEIKKELETHKKEDNGWGYVLGVGYEYNITDYVSLSLALDYSVFDFEAPDVGVKSKGKSLKDMENTTVQFITGLNFRF